jgi:hypothetical protein
MPKMLAQNVQRNAADNAEQDRHMPNADENAHEETKRLKMNQQCQ